MTRGNLALPMQMKQEGSGCQVEHHSTRESCVTDGQIPPEPTKTFSFGNFQTAERTPATEDGSKKNISGRKKKILCPKAKDTKILRKLDNDLAFITSLAISSLTNASVDAAKLERTQT